MRHQIQLTYPELAGKLRFYIGDVRNPDSVKSRHGRGGLYLSRRSPQTGSQL